MISLQSYGSDDDYDDSSEEKQTDWRAATASKTGEKRQSDANYEEVQMDLSEESNDSKADLKESTSSQQRRSKDRRGGDDYNSKARHESKHKDRKSSRSDREDRYGHRRDRERERKGRRSDSRERRRSRSPRRSEKHASRSRSRSRERSARKYSNKRYEKNNHRSAAPQIQPQPQPEKIVESQKVVEEDKRPTNTSDNGRFFMPGITGRFRDQIERRKQLWQKKDNEPTVDNKNPQGKKVWETTTFAQDTDGKVANKFKRLMGIRGNSGGTGSTDVLKKQEEMFTSMEQQYEVARTATHTMRGVGLGFGSYQR